MLYVVDASLQSVAVVCQDKYINKGQKEKDLWRCYIYYTSANINLLFAGLK